MIRVVFGLLLVFTSFLPGCIAIGGSGTKMQPTVGQELIDLKTALDKGVITQQEYDRQKTALLARGG